ncbi:murein biosynthesis integral membrane protein MurJ [Eggerthellaceae bacterium zg-887]|uniref:murein biosynthesis integral membrane protein MurJ n=1 Tax=Xiamenia xianingshaonis TaxID=2682776 RepID=UPI001408953D|nr:murein biosynthesis integral membrane protein MurJ [Xiamenia xianingshaonis]NHM15977.1 murein biosynthesis integral membrane protein MurJ [Xiamenia xianingshaonis]
MTDKLARAQHIRTTKPLTTAEIEVGGRHAGIDRTAVAAAVAQSVMPVPQDLHDEEGVARNVERGHVYRSQDPSETAEIFVGGRHAGIDCTKPRDPFEPSTPDPHRRRSSRETMSWAAPGRTGAIRLDGRHMGVDRTADAEAPVEAETKPAGTATEETQPSGSVAEVSGSAGLISLCVIISRITGFARTWAMAFALGSTLLSSSYQVANNLPNQLYELVAGGMIVTAFLPVYLSVKRKLGRDASNEYASNLLTIVVVLLGIVSLLCIAFPAAVIYTQSFYSDQSLMDTSVFFFQFFAVQIVFYGASAIVSGLLNANRDYLWSSIAPVFNNIIVIVTFAAFAIVSPEHPQTALFIIAIGNPLGVFVQMAIQIPALKRNGIVLRPRINLRDPALKETLGIGVPAVVVMLCSFAVVSVQNAASYSFADNGPSILAYARLWFTLPYAFLAVPITTAMFTELADMQAAGNVEGVKRGVVGGTNQILFFMLPFSLYLMVFSLPLVTLYHAGAFTMESVQAIAAYLAVLAFALPVYAVNTYLQKIFSSLRHMWVFAGFNFLAGAAQIAITMLGASNTGLFPIEVIAVAEVAFYVVADVCLFFFLRAKLGPFGLSSIVRAFVLGLLFGAAGAAAGAGVLWALETFLAPLSGSIVQALGYVVVGGLASLVVTFGLALLFRVPEAAFLSTLARKVAGRLGRG